MFRRLLLSAVVMVVVPFSAMVPASAAHATTGCTDGVAVTQFAFNPSSVAPGASSNLTLVLQNCTSQTIQGSTVWYGVYTGQNGQHCLTIDPPPPTPYTIAPGGTYTLTNSYGGLPGFTCPASLSVSANVNVNGVTGTVTTVTATLQFTAACASGIAVNQFSFNPATVTGGQASTLTLVLQNCTSQAVQGMSSWFFTFTWAGTGLPPGCEQNLDPIQFTYSMAPGGTATSTANLSNPLAGCMATGLHATANVSVNGVTGTAATATAGLVITPPATTGGCHVSYTPSSWQGGFTAGVTITNTGSTAINGWTLTFTFPGDQKITSAWNAAVTQTGASVTATSMSYNTAIPPGASQSFGFQGTWTASNAPPASFTVNGTACTLRARHPYGVDATSEPCALPPTDHQRLAN